MITTTAGNVESSGDGTLSTFVQINPLILYTGSGTVDTYDPMIRRSGMLPDLELKLQFIKLYFQIQNFYYL